MSDIDKFIRSIDNKIYNQIRKSKSDAEARRYLREHLGKQLILQVVGVPKVNSCICQEMTKQGVDSWHCRGCNTHWE